MQREQKSGQDMERLLLALQGRLGEEFHVKSDRDGEKTVFAVKKKGEEAGILLYPESPGVRRCLRNKGVWETAALLERMYKRKRSHLSKKELMGAKFSEVKGQIPFYVGEQGRMQRSSPPYSAPASFRDGNDWTGWL